MRKNKELQDAQVEGSGAGKPAEEEMVILTRTDAAGNVWPLEMKERQEPRGGRRKRKKVNCLFSRCCDRFAEDGGNPC